MSNMYTYIALTRQLIQRNGAQQLARKMRFISFVGFVAIRNWFLLFSHLLPLFFSIYPEISSRPPHISFHSNSRSRNTRTYWKLDIVTVALQRPGSRVKAVYRMQLAYWAARERPIRSVIAHWSHSSMPNSMCTYRKLAVTTKHSCKWDFRLFWLPEYSLKITHSGWQITEVFPLFSWM